ncbi:unnamed protein product [Gadus morhua 'NCC']
MSTETRHADRRPRPQGRRRANHTGTRTRRQRPARPVTTQDGPTRGRAGRVTHPRRATGGTRRAGPSPHTPDGSCVPPSRLPVPSTSTERFLLPPPPPVISHPAFSAPSSQPPVLCSPPHAAALLSLPPYAQPSLPPLVISEATGLLSPVHPAAPASACA